VFKLLRVLKEYFLKEAYFNSSIFFQLIIRRLQNLVRLNSLKNIIIKVLFEGTTSKSSNMNL